MNDSSPPLDFVSTSSRVGSKDACLAWLTRRYASTTPEAVELLLQSIENDVTACSALQWTRFSFPSDPHQPLHTNYNNEDVRNAASMTTKVEKGSPAGTTRIVVSDTAPPPRKTASTSSFVTEPSRHIFAELHRRREFRKAACAMSDPPLNPTPRPDLGGYVMSPKKDSARFLLFPQRHHTVMDPPLAPQHVPYYLRGTVTMKNRDPEDLHLLTTPLGQRLGEMFNLNILLSRRFPLPEHRVGRLLRSLGVHPAVVDCEATVNQTLTERRYNPERGKVQRQQLTKSAVVATVHQANPRLSLRGEAAVLSAHSHSQSVRNDRILRLSIQDRYHSAPQTWRQGTYNVRCAAGPGLEYHAGEGLVSTFAKFVSSATLEYPLPQRFILTLRHAASLMVPYEAQQPAKGCTPIPSSDISEETPVGVNGLDPVAAPTVFGQRLGEHALLWATQGPKWDPKLVRGFDNDYSNLHHAQQWYAIFSAEISRRRKGKVSDGFLWHPGLSAFANACFVDSFTRVYPRASVGVTMTSDIPRMAVDTFNKMIPHRLECSFSWFISFRDRQLISGMQGSLSEDTQCVRLSPVETFRHMRCGLTWRL